MKSQCSFKQILLSSLFFIFSLIPITLQAEVPTTIDIKKSGETVKLMVDRGQIHQATNWIKQAPEEIKQSAPVLYQQARIALKTNARADKGYIGYHYTPKGSQTAIQFLKQAQTANSEYAKTYSLLGHIYAIGEEFEKAKQSFQKAETLTPRHLWLDFNKALLAIKQENYKEASRLFRKNTLKNIKQNKSDPNLISKNAVYKSSWDIWKRISIEHPEFDAVTSIRDGSIKRVLPEQLPNFLKGRKKTDKALFVHYTSSDNFCQPCVRSNQTMGELATNLANEYDFIHVSFESWNLVSNYPDIAKPEKLIALPSQAIYHGSMLKLFQPGILCTDCKQTIKQLKKTAKK